MCALCLEARELVDSHIIPEFMYRALYDDKHRFHVLSALPDDSHRFQQKGLREKLLCADCEQRIGVHERYFSHVFGGGIALEIRQERDVVIVRGADYKAVRLFQLSILWRASVSTLPFFSTVSLGPHEERLRSLLHADDVGDKPWQYACHMFALLNDGKPQEDVIVQPSEISVGGVRAYRFIFGGHLWCYFVSSHQHPQRIETAGLDADTGEMRIPLRPLRAVGAVNEFARTLAAQGKLPRGRS